MNRAIKALLAAALLLAGPAKAVEPQRIAWLGFPFEDLQSGHLRVVRERLAERGILEGRNVVTRLFVPHSNEVGDLRAALREAIDWKPALIEVRTSLHAKLAMETTRTVPIVFSWVGDPLLAGLVDDMRRPGRNATGVSQNAIDLSQKRLELARQLSPGARTVALVYDRRGGIHEAKILPAIRDAAARLDFELKEVDTAQFAGGLGEALDSIAAAKPCAAVIAGMVPDPRYLEILVQFQMRSGIPVIDDLDAAARAGVLLVLSEKSRDHFRRVADITALVLAGNRPADIPVDVAARINLYLNGASARRMGIEIPQSIRIRAEEVFEK